MLKFAIFTDDGLPTAFYSEDVHGCRLSPVFGPWPQRNRYGPVPEPTDDEANPSAPIVGTEDDPEQIPPVVGHVANPDCLIPVDAIEITDEQWQELISNSGRRRWVDGKVVVYDPPPVPPVIPDRLSRRQFRLQLIDAGLLEQVEVWVSAQDVRTRAAYADSGSFLRSDEMLLAGFDALSFTSAQIDEFFAAASTL
ncbi:hypothetical protein AB4Y96_09400 [Phyllobacterium sp. TAF24]|uniref:hypothetical protein n=1 Tax=Phyllobacterium sp. TAF24 TaxID=3233068 RepID=UPI003F9AD2DA